MGKSQPKTNLPPQNTAITHSTLISSQDCPKLHPNITNTDKYPLNDVTYALLASPEGKIPEGLRHTQAAQG